MGSVAERRIEGKGNEKEVALSDLTRAVRRAVEILIGTDASFGDSEAAALRVTNEATRRYLVQVLQDMSDGYRDELLIDGILYRRSHDPGEVLYHSLNGSLPVTRATYRRVGERNSPTVVPLELEAGLVERGTPALGYSISLNLSKETSRDYVESMDGAHRKVPSRSTVERICKTVPFEEEREQGAPPKTRRKKRNKPYERTPPPPVDVNYHMAYVGTVGFVDGDGEFLATRKYASTHYEGPEDIVARMTADVRAANLREPALEAGDADRQPDLHRQQQGPHAIPGVARSRSAGRKRRDRGSLQVRRRVPNKAERSTLARRGRLGRPHAACDPPKQQTPAFLVTLGEALHREGRRVGGVIRGRSRPGQAQYFGHRRRLPISWFLF